MVLFLPFPKFVLQTFPSLKFYFYLDPFYYILNQASFSNRWVRFYYLAIDAKHKNHFLFLLLPFLTSLKKRKEEKKADRLLVGNKQRNNWRKNLTNKEVLNSKVLFINSILNKKNFFYISCKESRIEANTLFYGCFYLGPFSHGQSLTVANALRRTLLSDLIGIAITSVEIEGALHEYCSLPGVREPVLDILLNLKEIVLKQSTKTLWGKQIGYLQARGPGVVKASDLKLPRAIMCVDPNQYIATLADDGILNMKIYINQGKSYLVQIPNNKFNLMEIEKRSFFRKKIKRFFKSLRGSFLVRKDFPYTTSPPTGSFAKSLSSFFPPLKFFPVLRFSASELQEATTKKKDQGENNKTTLTRTYKTAPFISRDKKTNESSDFLPKAKQTARNLLKIDAVFMPVTKVNYLIESDDYENDKGILLSERSLSKPTNAFFLKNQATQTFLTRKLSGEMDTNKKNSLSFSSEKKNLAQKSSLLFPRYEKEEISQDGFIQVKEATPVFSQGSNSSLFPGYVSSFHSSSGTSEAIPCSSSSSLAKLGQKEEHAVEEKSQDVETNKNYVGRFEKSFSNSVLPTPSYGRSFSSILGSSSEDRTPLASSDPWRAVLKEMLSKEEEPRKEKKNDNKEDYGETDTFLWQDKKASNLLDNATLFKKKLGVACKLKQSDIEILSSANNQIFNQNQTNSILVNTKNQFLTQSLFFKKKLQNRIALGLTLTYLHPIPFFTEQKSSSSSASYATVVAKPRIALLDVMRRTATVGKNSEARHSLASVLLLKKKQANSTEEEKDSFYKSNLTGSNFLINHKKQILGSDYLEKNKSSVASRFLPLASSFPSFAKEGQKKKPIHLLTVALKKPCLGSATNFAKDQKKNAILGFEQQGPCYEKIILEVWTNGSIHPRKAVYESFKSLLRIFSKLYKIPILGSMLKSEKFYKKIISQKLDSTPPLSLPHHSDFLPSWPRIAVFDSSVASSFPISERERQKPRTAQLSALASSSSLASLAKQGLANKKSQRSSKIEERKQLLTSSFPSGSSTNAKQKERTEELRSFEKTTELLPNFAKEPEEKYGTLSKDSKNLFVTIQEKTTQTQVKKQNKIPRIKNQAVSQHKQILSLVPLGNLDLALRTYVSLKRAGINTLEQLTDCSIADLIQIPNFDTGSLQDVQKSLEKIGFRLKKK